jgi:hypothetical protein
MSGSFVCFMAGILRSFKAITMHIVLTDCTINFSKRTRTPSPVHLRGFYISSHRTLLTSRQIGLRSQ